VRRAQDRLVLSEAHHCVVSATATSAGHVGCTGALLLIPFPPSGDVMIEQRMHSSSVTGLVMDGGESLVFSCDGAGIVMVSALVARAPPVAPEQMVCFHETFAFV
jgi:hypothetical protein